jgi:hypothetical protein
MLSMLSRRRLVLKSIVAGVLGLPCVSAAMFPRLSLEDLVAQSEIIAQAKIGRSRTAWDAKHRFIWTHYQLEVTDSIRGAGGNIVVSEPGGKQNGVEQHFDGVLAWPPGKKVLVFLHRTPIGYFRTVGGPQGRMAIGAGQRVYVDLQGAEFAGPAGRRGTPLSAIAGMPLDQLKNRLRVLARELPERRTGR